MIEGFLAGLWYNSQNMEISSAQQPLGRKFWPCSPPCLSHQRKKPERLSGDVDMVPEAVDITSLGSTPRRPVPCGTSSCTEQQMMPVKMPCLCCLALSLLSRTEQQSYQVHSC